QLTITVQDKNNPAIAGTWQMSVLGPITQIAQFGMEPASGQFEVGHTLAVGVSAEDTEGQTVSSWTGDFVLTTSEPGCIPAFDNRTCTIGAADRGSISVVGTFLKVPIGGVITVVATAVGDPSITGTATYTVTYYQPGLATTINAVSGQQQYAPVGTDSPEPFVARVTDAKGVPVAGAQVKFSAVNSTISYRGYADALRFARSEFAMVARKSESALIFGGVNGEVEGTIEEWDPVRLTSTVVGQMLAARYNHTATMLQTGQVLIVGGLDPVTGQTVSSAEIFDPTTRTSRMAGQPVHARWGHTATLLLDGRVLIAGGSDVAPVASAEVYDPKSDTFQSVGSMAVARVSHTATSFKTQSGQERVLMVGGSPDKTVELFDPTLSTFSVAGQMSVVRSQHTATYLPMYNKILIAGGGNGAVTASCELYDVATGTFSAAGSMFVPRMAHTASLVKDRLVVFAGGIKSATVDGLEVTGTVEVFDCATGTFSLAHDLMKTPRFHHAAFVLEGRDETWLIGGKTIRFYPYEIVPISSCEGYRAGVSSNVIGSFGGQAVAVVETDTAGIATSPAFTAGAVQGWNNVQATVVGAEAAPARFTVFGYAGRPPGEAARFAVTIGSADPKQFELKMVAVGEEFMVYVRAVDDYGWDCPNFSGVVRLSTTEPGTTDFDGREIVFEGTEGGTKSTTGNALSLPTLNKGELGITATLTTDETVQGACPVTIYGPPAALILSAYPQTVPVGSQVTLTASVRDSNGTNVFSYASTGTVSTSSPGASSLDGATLQFQSGWVAHTGTILAQPAGGILDITVALSDYPALQQTVQINVTTAPQPGQIAGFALTVPSTTMQPGQSIELTIRARDASDVTVTGFVGTVSVETDPPNIVSGPNWRDVDFTDKDNGVRKIVGTLSATVPAGTLLTINAWWKDKPEISGHVEIHIIGGDTTPPAPPTGLTAVPGNKQVGLRWQPNTESDLAGYNVYYVYQSGQPWIKANPTIVPAIPGATQVDYVVIGLENNHGYAFVVTAVDTSGNESQHSQDAYATPTGDTTPPASPTGIVLTPGDKQMTVRWQPNTEPDLAGYNVYYSASPWTLANAALIPATSFQYVVSGLTNGVSYSFIVTAVDTAGNESVQSAAVSAIPAPDTTPPAPPTGLVVMPGHEKVTLTWNYSLEPDIAGYNVYYSSSPWIQANPVLIPLSVAPPWYTVMNLQNGTTYLFVVTAVDTSGNESAHSDQVSATPTTDTTAPLPPTGIAATPSNQRVKVGWLPNSEPDLAGYNVYYSSSPWILANTSLIPPTTTQFTVTHLTNGVTYSFVVTAVDTAGNESEYSAIVIATPTSGDTTPPAAPTGLTAAAGHQQVTLVWYPNSETDLAGYNVYYMDPASELPWIKANTSLVVPVLVPGTGYPTYTVTGLTNGVLYYFVVTAVDTSGNESSYSSMVQAVPTAPSDTTPPTVPTGLIATAGDGQVMLTWNANSEPDLAGYEVYMGPSPGTKINAGLVPPSPTPSYLVTGLTNGETYIFAIVAVDTTGNGSALSEPASATPGPDSTPPVAGVVNDGAQAGVDIDFQNSTTTISANWSGFSDPESGISGYEWAIGTSPGATDVHPFQDVGMATSASTSHVMLTAGATYYVTIRATNGAGLSTAASSDGVTVELTPPNPPMGLDVSLGPINLSLVVSWLPNDEDDIAGYRAYRSQVSGGPYALAVSGLIEQAFAPSFVDGGLTQGVTYYYVVTAVDFAGNESGYSAEACRAVRQVPNDPRFPGQWNCERMDVAGAWEFADGAGVVVALLDTGVDMEHEDLQGAFVPGWDFVDDDETPQDENGHGTSCAGVIAARANNGIGIAGI
ncbi:MAG: fibronectin type III domain-containing protein, partial [Planctomycetota bacterium]|nr:fibronectin type III domain-containing protein [Planctomycetota bacterium]